MIFLVTCEWSFPLTDDNRSAPQCLVAALNFDRVRVFSSNRNGDWLRHNFQNVKRNPGCGPASGFVCVQEFDRVISRW